MFHSVTSLTILKWVVRVAVLIIITAKTWYWLDPATMQSIGVESDIVEQYGGLEQLSPVERAVGFAIESFPALALIVALILLLRLLHLIESGRWHERQTENTCAKMGHAMLLFIAASVLERTLLALLMTYSAAPGERHLVISLSSDDVLGLIPALMAFVIAQLLRLAREQREELDEIV